jgi:hypothetical protein
MRGMLVLSALIVAAMLGLGGAAYWWAFVANYEDRPVPWGLASVSPDGTTVRIAYPRGDRTCYDLRRVERQETSESVVLEVIRKERTTGSCTDIYTQEEHDVELDAPLGERRLVDRCAEAPPPSARDLGERFGELWRAGLDRVGPTGDPELDICPGSSLVAQELAGM